MSSPLVHAILSRIEAPAASVVARPVPPGVDESHEYYRRYIERVPQGNLLEILRRQVGEVVDFFGAFNEAQAGFAYAPEKWTIKEVLGHLIDTERVFAFRATWFARQSAGALPGFSQDDWMAPADFNRRPLQELIAEWIVVRAGTIALLEGLPADGPSRRGIASEREFSVQALLYICPGHVIDHFDAVRRLYLADPAWPK